jgi:phosphate transport system permease protein
LGSGKAPLAQAEISLMNSAAVSGKNGSSARIALAPPGKAGDKVFRLLTWLMAMMVLVLLALVGWTLCKGSAPSMTKFGWHFFNRSNWDPVSGDFGALTFIYGTFISSFIGLLIALPLSLATAVYLTELAPGWVRQPAISMIEMLAAIPSVVIGLWGIVVLVPWLRDGPYPLLLKHFAFLRIFGGPTTGFCIFTAAAIIAIMILPIITSISREVLRAVPDSQREAAFALGATRWEVTRLAVLRYSTRGIFGAAMLGLGRALGETMAVTMVIGNADVISTSLLSPGNTLASKIANEYAETSAFSNKGINLSALFELGLMLLLVTVVTNILARLLIGAMGARQTAAT